MCRVLSDRSLSMKYAKFVTKHVAKFMTNFVQTYKENDSCGKTTEASRSIKPCSSYSLKIVCHVFMGSIVPLTCSANWSETFGVITQTQWQNAKKVIKNQQKNLCRIYNLTYTVYIYKRLFKEAHINEALLHCEKNSAKFHFWYLSIWLWTYDVCYMEPSCPDFFCFQQQWTFLPHLFWIDKYLKENWPSCLENLFLN